MIGQLELSFSHGFSVHVDRAGVVDQAVEYGVGQCGIADRGVPLVDEQLAGGDGGAAAVAVFEQVAAVLGVGFGQCPVVEYEDGSSGEAGQQFGVASVALGDGQLAQQVAEAEVQGGMAFAAGFVIERAGQLGFYRRWWVRRSGRGGFPSPTGRRPATGSVPDPIRRCFTSQCLPTRHCVVARPGVAGAHEGNRHRYRQPRRRHLRAPGQGQGRSRRASPRTLDPSPVTPSAHAFRSLS